MDEIYKVFVVFLFALGVSQVESNERGDGLNEKTREFILEDGKETREVLKAEMDGYFRRLEESLNQKLLASNSKIFSETEVLRGKVDANMNKLTQIDNLLVNMSEILKQNMIKVGLKTPLEVRNEAEKTRPLHENTFSWLNLSNTTDQVARSKKNPFTSLPVNKTEIISTTLQRTSNVRKFYGS